MIEDVRDTSQASLRRYDEIIDVRSPAEFALDHAPGAVNLPVLDDEQRRAVGTIYVQQSKFLANRIGAAIVSRNIADHLEGHLADKPGSYAPLIYCWRGGQRSASMATILSRVGWRVGLLHGGYKTYRRGVMDRLYGAPLDLQPVVIGGPTGSGKTVILERLAGLGLQVLDLEALALHRGSLFGALSGQPQPSQKLFESRLVHALDQIDPRRPVLVEAESSRIGDVVVPPALWHRMVAAPRIELEVPAPARARHIAAVYADIAANVDSLQLAISRLPRHHSRAQRDIWCRMAADGDTEALALQLIEAHYDPAYRQSADRTIDGVRSVISLEDLSDSDLDRAAVEIRARVGQLTGAVEGAR